MRHGRRPGRAAAAALLVAFLGGTPPPAAAEPVDGLVLYALDCGTMHQVPVEPFLPGLASEGERMELVDPCFLVRHPQGDLLWDVGFPVELTTWWAQAWMRVQRWLGRPAIYIDSTLPEALAAIGVAPADVDFLALSHTHFDHVGQVAPFAHATWLVPRAERDAAFDPERPGEYVSPDYVAPLADSPTRLLEGDYDVFGDGSVVLLSTPGHTEGHQCLFLDLPQTGPLVLSGDLYHTQRNRDERLPPAFNWDAEETRRSMERIEALLLERGARLWIQHAPEASAAFPRAPSPLR